MAVCPGLSLNKLHHVIGDRHYFEVLEVHLAIGATVHLQTELTRLLTRFVDEIRRAESIECLNQAITVRSGTGGVPLVILVADLFNELVVCNDPAATRNGLAANNTGGVPKS